MSHSPGPDRAPLSAEALRAALVRRGSLWRDVGVVAETGSTNADLAARAHEGAREGSVLVAEVQRAGRGRLGRGWAAPPRSSLTFSVLLRPGVPAARWSWLPLLTGLAVVAAVVRVAEVEAWLKWPNDVLVSSRKLAGILAERAGDAAVIGVGLNVTQAAAELPVDSATSLALESTAELDRTGLLVDVLSEIEGQYVAWRAASGDPERSGLRASYRRRCATLGRRVRIELPAGDALVADAHDVDAAGRLVVRTAEGEQAVSAGDVIHVR